MRWAGGPPPPAAAGTHTDSLFIVRRKVTFGLPVAWRRLLLAGVSLKSPDSLAGFIVYL